MGEEYDVTTLDPRCPNDGSRNVLYRNKDRTWWCRRCGQHFRINKKGIGYRIKDKSKGD